MPWGSGRLGNRLNGGGGVLGDLFGELIIKPLLEGAGYWTGKPIVRLLSFGWLHVSFLAEPDRQGKRNKRWSSVTFMRGDKRYLSSEAVVLVGFLAWAVAIAGTIWVARGRW